MRPEDTASPRYVIWPDKGFALLYCNKAGSRSAITLADNFGGQRPSVDPPTLDSFREDMARTTLRAQFVRDPMKRILSAYKYAMMLQRRWIHDNVLCALSGEMRRFLGYRTDFSFEEFVTKAFQDFPTDKHIAPQWNTHEGAANFVWPLEDSVRGWQELTVPGLPNLPKENASDDIPVDVSDLALKRVSEFYSEDFEWYTDVCSQVKFRAA